MTNAGFTQNASIYTSAAGIIYRQNPEIVDLEREFSVLSKEISQSNFWAKVQMPEIENPMIEN